MNGVSHFDNGRRLGRRASFIVLVCASVLMMATASAPSPIYPLYRERWGFLVTMLTVIFWAADGVGSLLIARAVQGLTTGTATGALAAWLVEFAPGERPHLEPMMPAVGTSVGMAIGAGSSGRSFR